MNLTCPQCATRYQADEAKFPPAGRAVRCAKCGHVWHQPGPVPEPEPAPIEDFLPKAEEQPAEPASPPRPRVHNVVADEPRPPWLARIALALGWLALGAIVVLIAFSVVRYRQVIATAWPQSASLYSAFGVNVAPHGIDFRQVAFSREMEDGESVLAVTGSIVNSANRELPAPGTIRVTLSDAAKHELYHWTFASGIQTLKPGQSVPFRTRLSSPPSGARHLEIRFDGP